MAVLRTPADVIASGKPFSEIVEMLKSRARMYRRDAELYQSYLDGALAKAREYDEAVERLSR